MKLVSSTATTVAAIAALALGACGPGKPAATDGASPAAAPAAEAAAAAPAAEPAAAPAAAAAASPDVEGPAAGKWRVTVSTSGVTMPPAETCFDKQTSLIEAQAKGATACSQQSFKREGGVLIGHYVCNMDAAGKPTTVTTDMRVTGDFATKYTMEMTNKMDPPPVPGMGEQKMTMTAERLGDC